jgi:NADH-ubiquinone oxidoreductase chain 3
MTSITFFLFFIPLLALILLAVNFIFAPHNPYQEKDSAFECGFHSFLGQNRTQFSISFFIFALLFLLFDLEILLVYPYVVSSYNNGVYGLMLMLIFFLALTLGFAFELGKNALKIDSRQMFNLKSRNSNITTYTGINNLTDLISEDDMKTLTLLLKLLFVTIILPLILYINPFKHPLSEFYREDGRGGSRFLNDDEMKERLMAKVRGQMDFNLIHGRKPIYDSYSVALELVTPEIL